MKAEYDRPTRNVMLTVSYDGTPFQGWQRQANAVTVQGLLEEALATVCGHGVKLFGSGRTDAGVHAKAQVANFHTDSNRDLDTIVRGSNALLPLTVAVLSAREMGPEFNARFSATGKTYAYDFLTTAVRDPLLVNRAWFVGPRLDWDRVQKSLPYLLGTKDFKAFKSSGGTVKSTVKTISAVDLSEIAPNITRLTITGSGFLRHMVRAIAGTLWLIGRGKLGPMDLAKIIDSEDRSQAGPAAPPQGLCLERVHYG
ncbi:MAG: tRNA pseudouridine(38-40) synthase TruA [Deltaproteobacteria bacterium]|jgi:tRNA pseudouridine38-40 synthase|nr:tRNA pseudouridine(38-40) synthase TruA [Deltaproteobacteria bacterium]